jgi:hypothetical protein
MYGKLHQNLTNILGECDNLMTKGKHMLILHERLQRRACSSGFQEIQAHCYTIGI